MRLGYTTNGFAHHSLADALTLLSEIGYGSVAITLEREHLDPPNRSAAQACVADLKPLLDATKLGVTIETGARFILDPRRKHQPTLVSATPGDRARRIDFLKGAVDVGASLSAESVSLWSGAPDDEAGDDELFDRLATGLKAVLDHAESCGVRLSFEPEPGMFIDTMARFQRLHETVNHEGFGLTLDVGHVHCLRDGDIARHIHRWRDVLWNVHIEDMQVGKHEHLMFGEGDMNFGEIFEAFLAVAYRGPMHVELSRHSHVAVDAARDSFSFLSRYIGVRSGDCVG